MNRVIASKLRLRELNHRDHNFIIKLLNEPSFIGSIGDKGVKDKQDAAKYLEEGPIESYKKNGFGLNLVELVGHNDSVPIGMCGLIKREELEDIDIGYAFLPKYCGRGYATEAAKMTLDMAKNKFHLAKIVAITKIGNLPSEKLLIKLGFSYEKRLELFGEENKYFSLYF